MKDFPSKIPIQRAFKIVFYLFWRLILHFKKYFQRTIYLKRCIQLSSAIMQRIGKILRAVLKKVSMVQSGSLANCKGMRPWGKQNSSTSKKHTAGPRLTQMCRGSFMCQNLNCSNVLDFGPSRWTSIRNMVVGR